MAESSGDPVHIALDDAYVYWTEFSAGNIMKAPQGGGDPVVIASGQELPDAIAVSATHVYWGGRTNLLRAPVSGGAAEPFADVASSVAEIALDDGDVYWAEIGSNAAEGAIRRRPLAGGDVVTLAASVSPSGLALYGEHVYFTDFDSIKRVPRAGGAVETVAPASAVATDIVAEDEELYWGEASSLRTAPIGGAAASFASGTSPLSITIDHESIYWYDMTTSALIKAARNGGEPTVLVKSSTTYGCAIDATYLYWADHGGSTGAGAPGSVKRIRK